MVVIVASLVIVSVFLVVVAKPPPAFLSVVVVFQDALVLFNTLPLQLWRPSDADVQLLQDWLLGLHPDDLLCQLSRRALAQMDWSTTEEVN